jgi:hypothetical protein
LQQSPRLPLAIAVWLVAAAALAIGVMLVIVLAFHHNGGNSRSQLTPITHGTCAPFCYNTAPAPIPAGPQTTAAPGMYQMPGAAGHFGALAQMS